MHQLKPFCKVLSTHQLNAKMSTFYNQLMKIDITSRPYWEHLLNALHYGIQNPEHSTLVVHYTF